MNTVLYIYIYIYIYIYFRGEYPNTALFQSRVWIFCNKKLIKFLMDTNGPNLRWFDLEFFNFMTVLESYEFSRNLTSNPEFLFSPALWICVQHSLKILVSGLELELLVSYVITILSSWYTDNHSVPTGAFYIPLSVEYSINYMRYSALYYKIDFVLDDFAHCRLVCKCSEHI